MRTTKPFLSVLVSACLAAPASAATRAAASIAGFTAPRIAASATLAPLAPSAAAFFPSPELAPLAFEARPVPAELVAPVASSPNSPIRAAARLSLDSAAGAASSPALENDRAASDSFWSGSLTRRSTTVRAAVSAALIAPLAAHAQSLTLMSVQNGIQSVPPPAQSLLSHAGPFLAGAAVLAGAFVVNRVIKSVLRKLAAKGMDRQKIAKIRILSNLFLWIAAPLGMLVVGGTSHTALAAVLGASGSFLTWPLRTDLGNVFHGVNYLINWPYAIGTRVQIGKDVGTVSDATLTELKLFMDDGKEIATPHDIVAPLPVIVHGAFHLPEMKLSLDAPRFPLFRGALGVIWRSIDRGLVIAAAATTALLLVPGFYPAVFAGWIATLAHYASAGATAWLAWRLDRILPKIVNGLDRKNSWRPETRARLRAAARAALWAVAVVGVMHLIGLSWTTLGASLGLSTLGVGIIISFIPNNILGTIIRGFFTTLFSKRRIGDKIVIKDHFGFYDFEGILADITVFHLIIKLDDSRHVYVPHALRRETPKRTPGK